MEREEWTRHAIASPFSGMLELMLMTQPVREAPIESHVLVQPLPVSSEADGERDEGWRGEGHAVESAKPARRSRPRKSTDTLRKEQKGSLYKEIELLEARLELLKYKQTQKSESDARDDEEAIAAGSLCQKRALCAQLQDAVHTTHRDNERILDLLSLHIQSVPRDPMKTFIHLSSNTQERRATLRALRGVKLRRAHELVTERLRSIDQTKPYFVEERFTTDDGSYHCQRFTIEQYRGFNSARQLFDILVSFMSYSSHNLTELMGQLPIEVHHEAVDNFSWHHRSVAATGSGYLQEINEVLFAHFDTDGKGSPYGVLAGETVDVDDLYPYAPNERVRMDATAALTVSQYWDPDTLELVVVLKRCVFLRASAPASPLPSSAIDQVHADIARRCDLLTAHLKATAHS